MELLKQVIEVRLADPKHDELHNKNVSGRKYQVNLRLSSVAQLFIAKGDTRLSYLSMKRN